MTNTDHYERPSMTLVDISTELTFEHLCDFRIEFEHHQIYPTPVGMRVTYVVKGGRFEGSDLSGEFLSGGGDWVVVGSDRVARLDVRATMRTHDGALIHITNIGRARLDDEATARLYQGELIRSDEMYARSSPLFETGDERYAWLNSVHTVAVNQFSLSEVHYRIYTVK
jgi:Protein of unknown function (DUF3237)